MHIAVVTKNLAAGGAERVIVQLLNEWCEQDIQCTLILLNKDAQFYKVNECVNVFEIGAISRNRYMDKLKRYQAVRKILKQFSPDIVLSMPEEIGIFVIFAMLGTGIPVVVSERNNPWVMPNKKITRFLRRCAYPFAKGLIFQTERAASFFPKRQQKKGVILPNPLDCSRLPDVYEGEREKVVVGAGRLDSQKNFPLLIRAFAKFYESHSDYRLVIYGEGGKRQELEALASALLPEEAWSMPGRVNDLPHRMASCSMFVLSSDYEGVPNVLIEAMAVGTPCVSTDCAPGGAAELIHTGENGLLVPVRDEVALVNTMCQMIDEGINQSPTNIALNIRSCLNGNLVCDKWMMYLKSIVDGEEKVDGSKK